MSRPHAKAFHVARGGAQGIASGPLAGAVVAIGNFDGVHRGHRAVIGAALKRAKALGRKAAEIEAGALDDEPGEVRRRGSDTARWAAHLRDIMARIALSSKHERLWP